MQPFWLDATSLPPALSEPAMFILRPAHRRLACWLVFLGLLLPVRPVHAQTLATAPAPAAAPLPTPTAPAVLPAPAAATAASAATANPPSASGPLIVLPPELETAPGPSSPPGPSPATQSDAGPASGATTATEEVPIQSPVVLSDQPPAAIKKSGFLALPRQSQIDVALDPRTNKLRGAAVGGYGEAIVNAPFGPGAGPAIADLRRTILYFGFNFTDRIRFFSEIEFEHALTTTGKQGEVAVEQALLDFMLVRWFNLRAGMSLVPLSLINLYHEPSTFNGVERPDADLFIIPSTWKQLVAGIFGAVGPLRYQVYVTPGLRAEDFAADVGIRRGVQDNLVRTRDWGVTGRIDYAPLLGLNLGLGGFFSHAGQGDPNLASVPVGVTAFDVKFARFGLSLRGQLSHIYIGDSERLNYALSLSRPTQGPVARQLLGGYVEVGYDLLRPLRLSTGFQLIGFARYERSDTQLDIADSGLLLLRRPGNDRSVYTLGLTFRPIFEIAVKLDYQHRHTEVPGSATNQLNAAIAYQF